MQNVTFSYKGKERYVFEDFSVDIEPNHITGIIGRNGQGKTTLMNLIAGKFEPDEGIIEIDGKNPATDIGTAKRIVYVAGVMSYSEIKLKKIIEEYRLMYEKFDEEFAYKLMELFGLNKKAKIKNLSKGQETIFNFCCGMATRADITILDEPVSGVDAISRNKIYEIILRDYIEHPRTILISSHMLGEMEKILSNMIMIGNNDVLFAGDIEELKDSVYRVDGELANIEKYCEEQDLDPRIDKTNFESIYNRNKIRNESRKKEKTDFKRIILRFILFLQKALKKYSMDYIKFQTQDNTIFDNISIDKKNKRKDRRIQI
jgi:ABC-2 type transport system ATP-binding protein